MGSSQFEGTAQEKQHANNESRLPTKNKIHIYAFACCLTRRWERTVKTNNARNQVSLIYSRCNRAQGNTLINIEGWNNQAGADTYPMPTYKVVERLKKEYAEKLHRTG